MSVNRENVIWQSENGKWNLGFFEVYENWSDDDEDYDFEWDVEYNFSAFEWVSRNHATEDAALRSWDGANPGMWQTIGYSPETADQCARYDNMATDLLNVVRSR